MVKTFAAHVPVTPAGKPDTVAPVATVVEYVIGVRAVLIHGVWALVPAAEVKFIVLVGFTVMVPVAVLVPPVHPPVIVIV